MKPIQPKIAIAWTIAILSGFALHFSGPIFALLLLGLYALAVFSSFVLLMIGLFSRKFRRWYLIGLTPIIVAYCFEAAVRDYKHRKAEAIVNHVDSFKAKMGRYPNDLREIGAVDAINGLEYERLSTSYRIEYLMDACNREYYESDSGKWGTLGWND